MKIEDFKKNRFLNLKEDFEKKGAIMVSTEYTGAHDKIYFLCSSCKKEYFTTYSAYSNGRNKNLVCSNCSKRKKLSIEEVKNTFLSKGAILVSDDYKNLDTVLEFICPDCGEVKQTNFRNFKLFKGDKFSCLQCRGLSKPSIEEIRRKFNSVGATLISETYVNNKTPLYFKCSKCGNIHHILWKNFISNKNPSLLCDSCMSNLRLNIDVVKKEFEEVGATLISTEVFTDRPIEFLCSNCGSLHSIKYFNFKNGYNKNLVCPNCKKFKQHTIEEIKKRFEDLGVTLISTSYVDAKTKLEFICPSCEGIGEITLDNLNRRYSDSKPVCNICSLAKETHPFNIPRGNSSRRLIDNTWYKLICKFFNVNVNNYSAHHIEFYSKNKDLRTSLTNGYPLLKEIHSGTFVDREIQIKNPFHFSEKFKKVQNWPDYAKLPYHTYDNFKFLDLSSKVVTEIVDVKDAESKNFILNRKRDFSDKNIFYIPIYAEEIYSKSKLDILLSLVRAKLYKFFPEIYKYTGTTFNKYYARKLTIKELSNKEVKDFFNKTHMQGFISAAHNIALMDGESIISCMSFGLPRFKNHSFSFELLRYSVNLNSIVIGGAQKLFKYFINTYSPESIVSFCDLRFSSFIPEDTLYFRLGFKFDYLSAPNYKYIEKNSSRMYSRQQFQKHKLKDKLDKFDASLSESKNMEINGYTKQYDCGNYKFIWRKQ